MRHKDLRVRFSSQLYRGVTPAHPRNVEPVALLEFVPRYTWRELKLDARVKASLNPTPARISSLTAANDDVGHSLPLYKPPSDVATDWASIVFYPTVSIARNHDVR
jgi:hypothetical protein